MKKIIIIDILLGIFVLLSTVALAVLCILLKEINASPQFLVHVVDYSTLTQYYEVQDKLIFHWKQLCIISIVFLTLVIIMALISVILFNFSSKKSPDILAEKELKKQARIQKLEAELEELKND